MKKKKYIKDKREYISPSIYVKTLQMESHLTGPSAEVNGSNGTSGDTTPTTPPGNPTIPPFSSGGSAKANSRVFFDDVTEE